MKQRSKKAAIERYLWKVRRTLPIPGKTKRVLLQQIRESIYEQTGESTELDEATLIARFGTPRQIIESYMENMSASEFVKDMRVRRRIIWAVSAAALAFLIYRTAVVGGIWWRHHLNDGGYFEEYITNVVRETFPEEETEE